MMKVPVFKDRRMQIPFGVAATEHGMMILPLNDWEELPDQRISTGVGLKVLLDGLYDKDNMPLMMAILRHRQKEHGDGVVMLDAGANVGCYTVSFAKAMQKWGSVLAFEPQERIFYALCGNIMLNNAMNARAFYCALDSSDGHVEFPMPDYCTPANYGSIGVAHEAEARQQVPSKRIDSLNLDRLDFLKVDVEGMELKVLEGALETIKRCSPFIMAEHIHAGLETLKGFFYRVGYSVAVSPMEIFAAYGKNEIIDACNGVP